MKSNASGRLLCIGLTTLDVVALPVQLEQFEGVRLLSALQIAPAGTAAGAALIAARLGVATQLLGAIGDDAMGRFIRGELAHAGVDVSLLASIAGAPTSATLIPVDDAARRMMYHAPGAAMATAISDAAPPAAQAARAIHYAGIGAPQLDGGQGAALLAAARRPGCLITCDLISPGPKSAAELRRVLPHVDVFMPSAVEARFVTGEDDLVRAAGILRRWGAGACVIKNGAEGALAVSAAGEISTIAAVRVAHLVDTTSCGDSFCAGFIAACLRGRQWHAALQFAAATAALVAQGLGTLGLLQSFEQVDALVSPEGVS